VYWYKNPGPELLKQGKMWEQHLLVDTQTSTNEGQLLHDLDGDGVPEWIVNSWRKDSPMYVWKFTREEREVTVREGNKERTVVREVPSLRRSSSTRRATDTGSPWATSTTTAESIS
jgi:hypothetical protein